MKNPTIHSASPPGKPGLAVIAAKPAGKFGVGAGVGLLVIFAACELLFGLMTALPGAVFVSAIFYGIAVLIGMRGLHQGYPHAALGLCNLVTLVRLVIVAILCAALLGAISPTWTTFALASFALALDGIDGWLARKQGLASDFGARFDVEVDAAFALILAMYAATNGAAGPWVILLGVPYYLFVFTGRYLPWLNGALPPRFSRKAVCVFQIAALIALQVPLLADGRLDPVIIAVAAALVWSFGRDILWLWRTKI
ncbi:CDP-alcohol phosphatidyltransferase family protein [Yoonia sp. BS5-3]|uniref:CDP-alcohol phosphatidyltransferase family protein n=1 Tax=Yoonia phaeophyticola TaxID=3137369 RepID=A0ABZ2V7D9_9RHOB